MMEGGVVHDGARGVKESFILTEDYVENCKKFAKRKNAANMRCDAYSDA